MIHVVLQKSLLYTFRRTVGPDHKDSPSEPDPFLNRKGYKRPPLLKALTSKNEEKENGTKLKRKAKLPFKMHKIIYFFPEKNL